MQSRTYLEYAVMEKFQFIDWLLSSYNYTVPDSVDSVEDMQHASELLTQVTNAYSFVAAVGCYISYAKRNYRREADGYEKGSADYLQSFELYEDFLDKEKIVETKLKCLDSVKTTLSRKITIKIEVNRELSMLGSVV